MTDFYSEAQRGLQDDFDTRRLADTLQSNILRTALAEMDRKFVAASDFFFLSTVDHTGIPTVSYKGGFPGFVKALDDRHLCFPIYDGNGMFISAGNIAEQHKIGMLFIDFEHPRRLRLHGVATVLKETPLFDAYPEAQLVVTVELTSIFTNCPRYIHRYKRVEASEFVPAAGIETPIPDWKRVDYLQDKLPSGDREKARRSGEKITEAEYRKHFWEGL